MSTDKPFPKLLLTLTILLGVILIAFYGYGLTYDPNQASSRLMGKVLPPVTLPSLLDSKVMLQTSSIKGPAVINVWASWCGACREEHKELIRIVREEGIPVYGVDYQDDAALAREWLVQNGNPFSWVMFDGAAAAGMALDIFSLPQTYVIDGNGIIKGRHIGALTTDVWQSLREKMGIVS